MKPNLIGADVLMKAPQTFEEIETNASQVLKRFGLPHEDRPIVSAEETEAPENQAVQNLRGDTTAMSTEKLR